MLGDFDIFHPLNPLPRTQSKLPSRSNKFPSKQTRYIFFSALSTTASSTHMAEVVTALIHPPGGWACGRDYCWGALRREWTKDGTQVCRYCGWVNKLPGQRVRADGASSSRQR